MRMGGGGGGGVKQIRVRLCNTVHVCKSPAVDYHDIPWNFMKFVLACIRYIPILYDRAVVTITFFRYISDVPPPPAPKGFGIPKTSH